MPSRALNQTISFFSNKARKKPFHFFATIKSNTIYPPLESFHELNLLQQFPNLIPQDFEKNFIFFFLNQVLQEKI
jgi:hypothetical protein